MGLLNSILWLIGLICAIWVIYDVWTQNKKKKIEIKVLWTILAIIFSIITAIAYYLIEKR